jgi:hypothetical protein
MGVFISAGTIEAWTIPLWCRMFVQTLIGVSRSWYDSLLVGRIDSFEDLHSSSLSISVNKRGRSEER